MILQEIKSSPGIWLLIAANLAVFLVMSALGASIYDPSIDDLLRFGGVSRPEVMKGDYWRLFSSLFVHGGILHLGSNLVMLFIMRNHWGKIVPPALTIALYLFCGLMASLASISYYENTVSVGASGALLGLCGMLMIFSLRKLYDEEENEEVMKLSLFVSVFSIVMGLGADSDNAAHVAGLLSGIVLGFIYTTFVPSN